MALTGPFFPFDSYTPIFEELSTAKGAGRDGSGQRLQCEGNLWESALKAWLEDEKETLKKQREESENRKAQEKAPDAHHAHVGRGKRLKKSLPESQPDLDADMEDKLWIGLAILKVLARCIHIDVLNSDCLATEPGCEGYTEELKMFNTSLLVSVPRKLEPYPRRTGEERGWMGKNAVRFYQAQRGTVPAEGAAPAAEGAAAPAAEGAAPAHSDGEASTPLSPGSQVDAGGPTTRSGMPEISGKVRSLQLCH